MRVEGLSGVDSHLPSLAHRGIGPSHVLRVHQPLEKLLLERGCAGCQPLGFPPTPLALLAKPPVTLCGARPSGAVSSGVYR